MKNGIATGMLRSVCCALALAAPCPPAAAIDAERDDVRKFMEEMRRKHGFDEAWLAGVIRDAEPQPRIIELMTKPAEQAMTWGAYRGHFLTAERIAAGLQFWVEHRDKLAVTERETGVAARTIVGILGVETFYGRITGRYRVLDALATLAFDYPPRAPYFRGELEEFLLLARENQIDTAAVLGSYAGAMGRAQFMPRSYRAYAQDGDGDGRRDLWGSWDDVIASVAHYLAKHGWRKGEPVLAQAGPWFPRLDGIATGALAPDTTVKALRDRGLAFVAPPGETAPAVAIRVDGTAGREYFVGFHNFGVVTRYNRSILYALATEDLGAAVEARLPATS